ncbi:hypothetical protein GPECTOR_5g397 [Gonium pectorale]|uniref:RING-type domain-containing protein n=1 Tax=Gonium pectorale TaxID=33097 RepID=A0A150GXA3_GONPE|nr:hypothetical protein GPECTOR_5g397 [Gonium pectorale]|eukprot:KXZ54312.1 hypothetical protein GPECTOR_5g397 [Gonium pectorale]
MDNRESNSGVSSVGSWIGSANNSPAAAPQHVSPDARRCCAAARSSWSDASAPDGYIMYGDIRMYNNNAVVDSVHGDSSSSIFESPGQRVQPDPVPLPLPRVGRRALSWSQPSLPLSGPSRHDDWSTCHVWRDSDMADGPADLGEPDCHAEVVIGRTVPYGRPEAAETTRSVPHPAEGSASDGKRTATLPAREPSLALPLSVEAAAAQDVVPPALPPLSALPAAGRTAAAKSESSDVPSTNRYPAAAAQSELVCGLCGSGLAGAVALQPCGHTFCAHCLSDHMLAAMAGGGRLGCPERCRSFERVVINHPARRMEAMLLYGHGASDGDWNADSIGRSANDSPPHHDWSANGQASMMATRGSPAPRLSSAATGTDARDVREALSALGGLQACLLAAEQQMRRQLVVERKQLQLTLQQMHSADGAATRSLPERAAFTPNDAGISAESAAAVAHGVTVQRAVCVLLCELLAPDVPDDEEGRGGCCVQQSNQWSLARLGGAEVLGGLLRRAAALAAAAREGADGQEAAEEETGRNKWQDCAELLAASALAALRLLVSGNTMTQAHVTCEALGDVVTTLRDMPYSDAVQEAGMQLLSELVYGNDPTHSTIRYKMVEGGAVKAVLAALRSAVGGRIGGAGTFSAAVEALASLVAPPLPAVLRGCLTRELRQAGALPALRRRICQLEAEAAAARSL